MHVFSIDLLISPLARCYQNLLVKTRRSRTLFTEDEEAKVNEY